MKSELSLLYVHDPMCSWCWGFKPVLKSLIKKLPNDIHYKQLLGGLAADSDVIMPISMQDTIQSNWKNIQQSIPNIEFNYDFWTTCKPRRSTYPACRAVISAKIQNPELENEMITAIQKAYYLNANNPSDYSVLINLADDIGLDINKFEIDMLSDQVNELLISEIEYSRSIGASSFPSLFIEKNNTHHPIVLDYNNADIIVEHIESFI